MLIFLRFARSLSVVIALCLVGAGAAMAASGDWTASNVRGTVLFLEAGKWQELPVDHALPSPAMLRTLGSGRLTINGAGVAFSLGGGSVLSLDRNAPSPAVSHLAGTLGFAVAASHKLVISTPSGAVTAVGARGRLTVSEQGMRLELEEGTATTVSLDGATLELAAGDSLELAADGNGLALGKPAHAASGKPADTPGQGNAGGNGNGNSNAGGNGNGNSGNSGGNGASGKDSTTSQGKGSGASKEKSNNSDKGD